VVKRLSVVLLVDARGRLLLQERDEVAPVAPDTWGMVGGQVEAGEHPEQAAHRELAEETGLVLARGLRLWREATWSYPLGAPNRYFLWTASTDATDEDIRVGEGRQIVFVPPAAIAGLALGGSAAYFVPAFLASSTYATLCPLL
jgi:8-oxo-dGTP pyrophosphatase MutT (NUDIX family)